MISGWRKDRQDRTLSRKIPSVIANGIISRVTGVRLHDYGCALKVYRAQVIGDLRLYGELHRFIPALAADVGAKVLEVPVRHHPRTRGKSKYGIDRTVRVVLDLLWIKFLMRFLHRPMHAFGGVGVALGLVGGLILAWLAFDKLVLGHSIGGRPLLLLGASAGADRRAAGRHRRARRAAHPHLPRAAGARPVRPALRAPPAPADRFQRCRQPRLRLRRRHRQRRPGRSQARAADRRRARAAALVVWYARSAGAGAQAGRRGSALVRAGGVVSIAANLVSAIRWAAIARALGMRAPTGRLILMYARGITTNMLLPGATLSGDLLRSYQLAGLGNPSCARRCRCSSIASAGCGCCASCRCSPRPGWRRRARRRRRRCRPALRWLHPAARRDCASRR